MRSGIVKDIRELNHCCWSGHSALAGTVDRKWQDCEYVLSYFGKDRKAQRNYLRYVDKGIAQGRRPELVGVGLIRSLGSWSAVLALRRRGEKQASDNTDTSRRWVCTASYV